MAGSTLTVPLSVFIISFVTLTAEPLTVVIADPETMFAVTPVIDATLSAGTTVAYSVKAAKIADSGTDPAS